MSFNICFGENYSCSTCCGLHNLDMTQDGKKKWLEKNTSDFLSLKNIDRKKILAFREAGEYFLEPQKIRMDVYVCPFMGIVDDDTKRTGCLLHKQGSPHPQIRTLESPQSCSFYGESICTTYNCISKQNNHESLVETFCQNFTEYSFDVLTYGKIVSNHNLFGVYNELSQAHPEARKVIMKMILKKLDETEIPVTSFEMPLSFNFYNETDLWNVLGSLFETPGYVFDAFSITSKGRQLGHKLSSEIQALNAP